MNMLMYSRDISQAYIQSESKLERDVYVRAPPEMNLPPSKILKVLKPLCGIPESCLHWFVTYMNHYRMNLGMRSTRYDPCILHKRDGGKLVGMIVLKVDESFGFGTEKIPKRRGKESRKFKSKPQHALRKN